MNRLRTVWLAVAAVSIAALKAAKQRNRTRAMNRLPTVWLAVAAVSIAALIAALLLFFAGGPASSARSASVPATRPRSAAQSGAAPAVAGSASTMEPPSTVVPAFAQPGSVPPPPPPH